MLDFEFAEFGRCNLEIRKKITGISCKSKKYSTRKLIFVTNFDINVQFFQSFGRIFDKRNTFMGYPTDDRVRKIR